MAWRVHFGSGVGFVSPFCEEVGVEALAGQTDQSKIVKTFAMQALANLAERDPSLRPEIIRLLEELTATRSPAMRSRGRKLLVRLN